MKNTEIGLDERRVFRDIVRRNLQPMQDSAVYVAIFTDNFERDAVPVMQFSLAVLMNKPIYLVCPRGREICENVRRLAWGIAYFDEGNETSLAAATKELVTLATKDGHLSDKGADA